MKKIIEVVNDDTNKIIYKNNYDYKYNESVLNKILNSNLDLPDNITIKITTIKDEFKINDLCYYNDTVCKILKIDTSDDTAKILLYTKPIKLDWCYLGNLDKIDNEELEEEITND